jgi:hypothetical protein
MRIFVKQLETPNYCNSRTKNKVYGKKKRGEGGKRQVLRYTHSKTLSATVSVLIILSVPQFKYFYMCYINTDPDPSI